MSFPVIFQNKELTFNVSPPKPNGISSVLTLGAWLTKYGLIIPVDYTSYIVRLAIIQNTLKNVPIGESSISKAILFTGAGFFDIRIIVIDGVISLDMYPISGHDNSKSVRSGKSEIEEHVTALFSLNWNNEKIINYLKEHTCLYSKYVQTWTVEELMKLLVETVGDPEPFNLTLLKDK